MMRKNAKSIVQIAALASAAWFIQACGPVRNNGSAVSSVGMSLPDRSSLKSQVPEIETLMNAYRLTVKPNLSIQPVDPACTSIAPIDKIAAYTASVKLDSSLKQNCNYDVTLELGNLAAATAPAPGGLAPATPTLPANPGASLTTYEGQVKKILQDSCVGCHDGSAANGNRSNLSTYAQVFARGDAVVNLTLNNSMPREDTTKPNLKPMTQDQRLMLEAWKNGGYLEKADSTPATPPSTTPPSTTPAPTALTAVYYRKTSQVTAASLAGKTELKLPMVLDLMDGGKAIGLK